MGKNTKKFAVFITKFISTILGYFLFKNRIFVSYLD